MLHEDLLADGLFFAGRRVAGVRRNIRGAEAAMGVDGTRARDRRICFRSRLLIDFRAEKDEGVRESDGRASADVLLTYK